MSDTDPTPSTPARSSYLFALLALMCIGGGIWPVAPLAITVALANARHDRWYRRPAAWLILAALMAGIISGSIGGRVVDEPLHRDTAHSRH